MRSALLAIATGLLLASGTPAWAAETCPPAGWTPDSLQALKKDGFHVEDDGKRQRLARDLLACLSHPDPELRDGMAFEALSTWLRSDAIDAPTRLALLESLQAEIFPMQGQGDGFAQPFAALVLAEVARTDRVQAWLTPAQRAALVESGTRYLQSVQDYRGFVAGEGWRHGVAHGADLLMQLAFNPALDKAQLDKLLAAVAAQVAPRNHAYVFGEPERLARPVLFVAARGLHTEAEWKAWLDAAAAPPAGGWSGVFKDAEGLARRHDVRAFLLALYVQARDSEVPGVQALLPALRAQLEAVP